MTGGFKNLGRIFNPHCFIQRRVHDEQCPAQLTESCLQIGKLQVIKKLFFYREPAPDQFYLGDGVEKSLEKVREAKQKREEAEAAEALAEAGKAEEAGDEAAADRGGDGAEATKKADVESPAAAVAG